MFAKRVYILAIIFPILLLVSCSKKDDGTAPTRWGKENYYTNFLWVKHVPDTLSRTMEFDFNQDAELFMDKPLRLGLYKKTDSGKMLPVTESEMQVYANGVRCENNIIDIWPSTSELTLGIVFNSAADNKVHHWFFRAVEDGGLDRINGMDFYTFNAASSSLMEIEVEKNKVMNPLAEGLLIALILLLIALLVWLFVLKAMFFPSFRVGKISLTDPAPYSSLKRLRGYRKMVLTSKKPEQGFFSRLFTGKILYEVNQLWTSDVTVEPKDRKSVRLRYPKEYLADSRVLKTNQEYTIQNMTTGTKTKIKIS